MMATQLWIRQALDAHEAPYQELHHCNTFTAQQLAEVERVSGHFVAKVVVVVADGRMVQAVLPATKLVDLDLLAKNLDATECRLASEEEISETFGDCEVGAVPPMRRWPGIDLIMDTSLASAGDIVFPAGTHRDAIRMSFRDWAELIQPREGRFSVPINAGRRDTGALGEFEEFEA